MSKIAIIHGTTRENLDSIMKDGFNPNHRFVWNCSEDEETYFWNTKQVQDNHDCDLEQAYTTAFREAYHSASYAACVTETDGYLYAIVVEIDEKYIRKDSTVGSDENACSVLQENLNEYGEIVSIKRMPFNKYFLPYIAHSIWDTEQFANHNLLDGLYEVFDHISMDAKESINELFDYEADDGCEFLWNYKGNGQ